MRIEKQFEQEAITNSKLLSRKYGYNPGYFYQMMSEHGALGAAKLLLIGDAPQDGFSRLWEIGRPDLSIEYMALTHEYRDLFDHVALKEASRRLLEFRDARCYEQPVLDRANEEYHLAEDESVDILKRIRHYQSAFRLHMLTRRTRGPVNCCLHLMRLYRTADQPISADTWEARGIRLARNRLRVEHAKSDNLVDLVWTLNNQDYADLCEDVGPRPGKPSLWQAGDMHIGIDDLCARLEDLGLWEPQR